MSKMEIIRAIKKGAEVQTDAQNFCLPAIVESFDASNQSVSVKLAVNEKENQTGEYFDNNSLILPEIRVVFLASSNTSFLTFPIKKGDTGALIVCDCDIENFLAGDGSITDAISERRHDLTDCFFIPGFFPDSKTINCDSDNIKLKNGNITIILDPSGKISITGATDEMLTVISAMVGYISGALTDLATSNCISGSPLSNAAAAVAKITTLNLEKIKFDGLKI